MRNLLLVSTSTTFGTGYLEHCARHILQLFREASVGHVLFVPYALFDRDAYTEKAQEAFVAMGLGLESIHNTADPVAAVEKADGIFIGGGNTFRLLKTLHDQRLVDPIRRRARAGMPYLGTSAGSNVACPTIMTTNDMPIVYPPCFEALDLVPFQINAHYQDPDPESTHMGETRVTRIAEFHQESATPVIGLREGAMLRINQSQMELTGDTGGKLFLQGKEPVEIAPGSRLDEFLASR